MNAAVLAAAAAAGRPAMHPVARIAVVERAALPPALRVAACARLRPAGGRAPPG